MKSSAALLAGLVFGLVLPCRSLAQPAAPVSFGDAVAPLPATLPLDTARPDPPAYQRPRYEEDWSYLRNGTYQKDFWNRLKYISLSAKGNTYLSLGGEVRLQYERFENADFGAGPQDKDGYYLQRYLLHTDLHLGERVRFFGQLKSGIELGRSGGPRPFDEDYLDVHQVFADVVLLQSEQNSLLLRVGRQEMNYGSGRLVALREGPNVLFSFDGIRASLRLGEGRVDVFATRPVETDRGFFDDEWETDRAFWGVYGTRLFTLGEQANVDAYYLGIDDEQRAFDQGVAHETRHMIGARLYGRSTRWRYDLEAIGQAGRFGSGNIRAWRLATKTGYLLGSGLRSPQIGLKADIASGDRNPADPDLQTFNSLFQSGEYSGRAGILGPANALELEPTLEYSPIKQFTIAGGWGFFWRQSTRDGIYTVGSTPLRTGQLSQARYLGSRVTIEPHWQVNRRFSVDANYIHVFTANRFAEQTRPVASNLGFFTLFLTYLF